MNELLNFFCEFFLIDTEPNMRSFLRKLKKDSYCIEDYVANLEDALLAFEKHQK